jgi:hypothetical protein
MPGTDGIEATRQVIEASVTHRLVRLPGFYVWVASRRSADTEVDCG